ncbi:MAG: GNAT family N-acetyltransferase [Gemmatimonadales bacterium]
MTTGTRDFTIRGAVPADNPGLIALASSCAMKGDVVLRIDRGPDFFALNRLEGDRWRVGVAERGGEIAGCVAVSERSVFVNGREMRAGYAGDLKVHPAHRNTSIADALSQYAEAGLTRIPATAPAMITVLAGNRSMERRLSGPRGIPAFRRLATIRTFSVPILWRRRDAETSSIRVTTATWSDLDELAALWSEVAPRRQLAPTLSASSMVDGIRNAPGLDISSYRLARAADGRLLGFFAVWDQRAFKQLNVVGYSRRMKVARSVFNVLAPAVGSARLPSPGSPLNCVSIAHICVPAETPEILRALAISAHNELRGRGFSFLNIGLDTRDPLCAGVRGLFAQPTDVNAYVMTIRGGIVPEPLDVRPMHYEIALV